MRKPEGILKELPRNCLIIWKNTKDSEGLKALLKEYGKDRKNIIISASKSELLHSSDIALLYLERFVNKDNIAL